MLCCAALCRVTPQGLPPAEGLTATKAWHAVYAGDEAGKARSLGLSGGWRHWEGGNGGTWMGGGGGGR